MSEQQANVTSLPVDKPKSEQIAGEPSADVLAAYKLMLTFQFIGALVLLAILAVGLLFSYFIEQVRPPILVLVTLSGMLGAFFSALTRLYNVDGLSMALITPTVRKLEAYYLLMYSLVPPIVGGVAAVVLYVAFIGDFFGGGGLFPEMGCKGTGKTCTQLIEVLNNYGPVEAKDYGKVLIWAFVAGFSERFVPDTLQSLVAKSQKSST